MHIAPYAHAGHAGHDPDRARKLLLHKREIASLRGKVEQKGLTIVPTQVYLKQARAKVEIALARGKPKRDKRRVIEERDARREMRKQTPDL
jgi:SsrA-binding protein